VIRGTVFRETVRRDFRRSVEHDLDHRPSHSPPVHADRRAGPVPVCRRSSQRSPAGLRLL
jgi:hypothetical protein